jgi:hypothetical protein
MLRYMPSLIVYAGLSSSAQEMICSFFGDAPGGRLRGSVVVGVGIVICFDEFVEFDQAALKIPSLA